ncbi:hypothetical protein FQR65_LT00926 [Abscondita terminalis]|nr:hypothetical protein FQR65_LT00926 [Abscondita terminalis]
MLQKLVIAFLFAALPGALALISEEYHWKEYRGEIPEDAVPGGVSVNGQPIYIGQVLYADKLLPAKIYKNDDKAYFAWNMELKTSTNIKILCSSKQDRFKWIPISKGQIHTLTNHHIIRGGYEPGYVIYIGRALYKSETLVGKVRTGEKAAQNSGLAITSDGKITVLDTFEILTYEPEPNTTEIRHCNKKVVIVRN